MPAARSVSEEPAVETSCATHIRAKSRLRNTAVGDTRAAATAWLTEPPSLAAPRRSAMPVHARPSAPPPGLGDMPCEDWAEVYGGSEYDSCLMRDVTSR